MKILVIDDERFARRLLTHQLAQLGLADVTCYERGSDALARLEAGEAVELIISDLQMPEMDGVEFVRHLVRLDYRGGLVLVSGEDSRVLQTAERLAKAHQLKVLGALCKPASPEGLREIIARTVLAAAPARAERKIYRKDEIQRAIVGGELLNHYQPKVDLASGRVVGVETLVRWRHREDGIVYPDQFIGAAEENGLIHDLTRRVLINALCDGSDWETDGVPMHVAVNVSMDNLTALEFPDFVARAVEVTGFPVTRLILEVTESRLMRDPLAALDILTRLRLKRAGLSIDDFGTGHSSLVQLRDIPFTELKVDGSFVHGACRDASLQAILKASLAMARQLNMCAVGEGVEDRDDWDFLRTSGCQLAQGWFIGKPMPAEQLPGWIADWELRRPELVGEAR